VRLTTGDLLKRADEAFDQARIERGTDAARGVATRYLQRPLQEFVAKPQTGGRARTFQLAAGIAQGAFAGFGGVFEDRLALALRVKLRSLLDQVGIASRAIDLLAQSVKGTPRLVAMAL
jgi:hypothetical protein